jgi:predicted AlkP superfamily phosphohydrolase/phosphomutase
MNGIHVSGFVSIDINKSVYPPVIVDQLSDINYRLDVDSRKAHTSMHSFLEDLDNTLDSRVAAYRYLWDDSIDWSTFMLVFTGTDRLMHFLWEAYENPKHKLNTAFSLHFGRIDKIIGEIMSKLRDDNLVVMLSDHGFENLHRDVYVNRLLCEGGFLSLENEKKQLDDICPQSKAFAMDPARIYLNYQDKYPKGTVSRAEATGLLDELEKYFYSVKYNGRKVIKTVFRKEEIFKGAYLEDAPDMVLLAEKEFNLKAALSSVKAFDKGIFTGKHTQDSAFMLFHGLKDASIVPEVPNVQDMRWIIEKDRKIRYRNNVQ